MKIDNFKISDLQKIHEDFLNDLLRSYLKEWDFIKGHLDIVYEKWSDDVKLYLDCGENNLRIHYHNGISVLFGDIPFDISNLTNNSLDMFPELKAIFVKKCPNIPLKDSQEFFKNTEDLMELLKEYFMTFYNVNQPASKITIQ
jgi:hypothetical protein